MKPNYPYLNTSLDDLPGEKWKDICGYEGSYQVSSHGRIKSFPKYIEAYIPSQQRSICRWTKLCIRKQKVHTKINTIVNRSYYECTIVLKLDNAEKTYIVHRLVYHAFIHPIDFEKDKLMVMHKNGDGLDNHHKNLIEGTRDTVSKNAYDRKRLVSPFAVMCAEEKRVLNARTVVKRLKGVVQYHESGESKATFSSIKEASEKTGIAGSNIVEVIKGRRKSAGGSLWKYKIIE